MTLQTSGTISLDQIRTEFEGVKPTPLSSYYRGGSLVSSTNSNVPLSGPISLSNFYGARRISSTDIIAAMGANAGSYVSAHPSNYTVSMVTWPENQTFSATPITRNESENVFRDGDTNNSTFTAKGLVNGFGVNQTTAIAWQSSRENIAPLDPRINGSTVSNSSTAYFGQTSVTSQGKRYYQNLRMFTSNVELTPNATSASVDFQTSVKVVYANDKGGILLLPGEWEIASVGSALGSAGNVLIPPGQIALFVCCGEADGIRNLFNFGSNSNLEFILNYTVRWYDNLQAVFVGNPTENTQSIVYALNSDRIQLPIPVFFKLAGE